MEITDEKILQAGYTEYAPPLLITNALQNSFRNVLAMAWERNITST